uniref:Putative chaperone n=1 Tax=viral metagenome TaxID=1070528 RepID=A0A6M3L7V7_9ZZZZ
MRPLGGGRPQRRPATGRSSYGRRVASLRYLPNGGIIALEAPFDREFTESMKKSLPTKKRTWDANDKVWYVISDQLDKLCHLLDQYFDETILLDFPAAEVRNDSWTKLMLVEGAPMELIRAAYRVLSVKHHPDKGGDPERMKEINLAYKELMGGFVSTNGDTEKGGV